MDRTSKPSLIDRYVRRLRPGPGVYGSSVVLPDLPILAIRFPLISSCLQVPSKLQKVRDHLSISNPPNWPTSRETPLWMCNHGDVSGGGVFRDKQRRARTEDRNGWISAPVISGVSVSGPDSPSCHHCRDSPTRNAEARSKTGHRQRHPFSGGTLPASIPPPPSLLSKQRQNDQK